MKGRTVSAGRFGVAALITCAMLTGDAWGLGPGTDDDDEAAYDDEKGEKEAKSKEESRREKELEAWNNLVAELEATCTPAVREFIRSPEKAKKDAIIAKQKKTSEDANKAAEEAKQAAKKAPADKNASIAAEKAEKAAVAAAQELDLLTIETDVNKADLDVCTNYCGADAFVVNVCDFKDPMLVAVGLEVAPEDMVTLRNAVIEATTTSDRFQKINEQSFVGALDAAPIGPAAAAGELEGSVTALLQRGLGALARVIADRAKREAIGWLLDDVASELCGTENAPGKQAKDVQVYDVTIQKCEGAFDVTIDDTSWAIKIPDGETGSADQWTGKHQAAVEKIYDVDARLHSSTQLTLTFGDSTEHSVTPHPAGGCVTVKRVSSDASAPNQTRFETTARAEVRDHWLPNLCALARDERLDHYGAGAALLEALQGALENDVRGWPGVIAGIGLGELHWAAEQSQSQPRSLAMAECKQFDRDECEAACAEKDTTCSDRCDTCDEVADLRSEGKRFVARLLEGRDPAMASRDLGTAISSIVVDETVTDAPLELLACAASLPAEIALLEPEFAFLDRPLTAAILAGLVRAPACWELTGMGLDSNFKGGKAELARAHPGKARERISTILRLGKQVQTFARVQVEFEVLSKALANLESSRKRETTGDERAREVFLATLGVVDASLASADALLVAVGRFSDVTQTFPALADTKEIDKEIEKVREQITELRDLLDTLQGFGTGDYAKAITASSTLMLAKLGQLCEGATTTGKVACNAHVDVVGRHIGTVTALLVAKDVDEMSAALDAAANPPGGWRSKAMDGNFTVSLSAYAGFFGGGEARWGQYGAVLERGGAYAQAPALALPFGLDLTWGMEVGKRRRNWAAGLFFPVLDPAAFLLYDVDKGGKLPGARPVTALSPGLAVRLGIPNTPLAFLLSATYRPQLRTWQATVNGPGANVLQFGVSVAVDVTLWKIFARGK
jgi:hypothetical protein